MSEPLQATRDIEVITGEILFFKAQAGGAILEIGRRLIEVKEQLDHGRWLGWLEEKVEFSEVSAQRLMRLAREYSNPSTLTDLGPSKALALLTLPESEREDFISKPHEVNGQEKTVQEMSHRELKQALKERDEARQAAEAAQAEAKNAEEARAKMERDMKVVNASLKDQKSSVKKLRREADQLQAELKELKSRPVEVAVETREPTVEELARLTAKAVEEAQASDRERIAAMEKQLATADGDVSAFRVHFEAWMESYNKMSGYLARISGRDPERAGKLRMAVQAAVERMAEDRPPSEADLRR